MILNPIFLLGLPVFIGGLLYIYRNKGRFVKKVVSTLLFFTGRTQESSLKLRLPLRFWLEVLIVSILFIVLAGPSGTQKHYVLVIDNSLSTGRTLGGKTLLDLEKEKATEVLLTKTTGSFTVVTTNPDKILVEGVPGFVALQSLRSIEVSKGVDNLQSVLDRYRDYDEILVFSDKESLTDSKENITIRSARFLGDGRLEIKTSSKALVQFESGNFSKTIEVDGVALIKIPESEIKVSIKTPNLNRFDDEVLVSKTKENKIHLVSQFSARDLGLGNLTDFNFSKEEGYVKLIHRRPIPSVLDGPTVVIAPEGVKYEPLEISRWEKDSEIVRYANLSLFKPKLVAPLEGEGIVYAQGRPVLTLGEKNGFPLVVVGFEILPFEGRRTPTSSVLLINILKFLTKDVISDFYPESESFPSKERVVLPEAKGSKKDDLSLTYYLLIGAIALLIIDGVVRW